MISSAKIPGANSGAATAPTAATSVATSAPASATATSIATPVAVAPASPFDAILTLEALAATCNALDPAATTPEAGDTGDLLTADVDDRDDTDASDAEDPLAFLASLINAVVTPQPQPAAASSGGDAEADDSVDDVLAGKGHRAAVPSADMPISLLPQTGADDATGAAGPLAASASDASTAKLLTAMVPTTVADPNAARGDSGQSADAGTANLARAVEMLGHGTRHAAAATKDSIPTPVRDPNWAQDLGTKVAMMIRGGESTASLQLSPVDLGPLDVSVTVRDSQATVHFGAAQAETRALLEASIPRLREMLAAQGFNLMDASVSQGFARQPRAEPPPPIRHAAESETEVRTTARISPLGLLDTYA